MRGLISARHPRDGRSLRPLLDEASAAPAWREAVAAETIEGRMLRYGDWKYVCRSAGTDRMEALFNLAEDPGETRNRFDDPAAASALDAGRKHLDEHFRNTKSSFTSTLPA